VRTRLDKKVVALATSAALALSVLYQLIATVCGIHRPFWTTMWMTLLTEAVVLFGYEVFFAVQRAAASRRPRVIEVWIDGRIPFYSPAVWVYGGLYYAALLLPIAFTTSPLLWCKRLLAGFVMVVAVLPLYSLWPTSCPPAWRQFDDGHRVSMRLLNFIRSRDDGRACLPSMHCALAAYSATLLPPSPINYAIPLAVAASCLLVKQHSFWDTPAGLALGVLAALAIAAIS
jgi:hypothetical protein